MSNFFASQKPLLKNAYASFLQAKTFTKKCGEKINAVKKVKI
jgi:hypothetical protein